MEDKIMVVSFVLLYLIADISMDLLRGNARGKRPFAIHTKHMNAQYKNNKQPTRARKERPYMQMIGFAALAFSISYILTQSYVVAFLFGALGVILSQNLKRRKRLRETVNMEADFRNALQSLLTSVKSGMSLRTSVTRCCEDLERTLVDTNNTMILQIFLKWKHDLDMGIPMEEALLTFYKVSPMEAMHDFASAVLVLQGKGGNITEVFQRVIQMITDKMAVTREIQTLTAGKKMESKLISALPVFVIVILSLLAPAYMKPLFESILGQCMVIVAMILLLCNTIVSRKITKTDV